MGEKFENFSGENLQGIFRGNVRECLGILGDFLGKIYQREMSPEIFGGIIRKILRGMFLGKCDFSGGIRDT